jgi:heme/copper-type cytochrome/quinol oxidase subunit 2
MTKGTRKFYRKNKEVVENIIIYLIILIGLVVLVNVMLMNAKVDYNTFRDNKNYFGENSNPQIQSWMNPETIIRHFNITEIVLYNNLGIKPTEANSRTPLYQICKKNKVDCVNLINRLNNLTKG